MCQGESLTLGIRPEHLEDAALLPPGSQNGSVIEAPVDVVEHLGSELLVYARAGGHSMTARIDPHSDAHTGGTMRFKVENECMHLFETETGQAIF